MPAPEEPSNERTGGGKQARTVSTLGGGAFQDELGVLPIRMARVTAARIFAARIWQESPVKFGRELLPKK